MESLQVTLGRFLMQVFILLPVFLIAFFILTLVLFRRAPEGSELRRRRTVLDGFFDLTGDISDAIEKARDAMNRYFW